MTGYRSLRNGKLCSRESAATTGWNGSFLSSGTALALVNGPLVIGNPRSGAKRETTLFYPAATISTPRPEFLESVEIRMLGWPENPGGWKKLIAVTEFLYSKWGLFFGVVRKHLTFVVMVQGKARFNELAR